MVDDPNDDAREKAINLLELLLSTNNNKHVKDIAGKCNELKLDEIIAERLKKVESDTTDKEEREAKVGVLTNLLQVFKSVK